MNTTTEITKAAAALGRKGGATKTPAKSAASAANGAKGGRPVEYEYVVHWTKMDGRKFVRDHQTFATRVDARRAANAIAAEQEVGGGASDARVTKRKLA